MQKLQSTINKLDKSRIEIVGTIPVELLNSYRSKALQSINDEITVDGFRKGKIPENILISKVGEMTILEEMAELAIGKAYPNIVLDNKLDVIGRPEVHITKIAKDTPLEFKIVSTVVPDVTLADYKKVTKDTLSKIVEETPTASDEEVEKALLRIRRSRANHENHDHDENMTEEEHNKLIDASLPEVNDEFAQSLGDFKDVSDMKEKIKEALISDKKSQTREKRRIALSDKLVEESTIDIPDILVESELRRIEAQFNDDISRMGVSLEDYLKHAKKSIEDIRKEWRPHAEKKARLQLVLNKIADAEKITADPKEIEEQVNHIIEHYSDADRDSAYVYADTVLTNEKVFQFLENL